MTFKQVISSLSVVVVLAAFAPVDAAETVSLLNVSYDPTRELYQEFNTAFIKEWKTKTGQTIAIKQSHGGSSKQARAVIDGLQADVVTLALAHDVDAIAEKSASAPCKLASSATPQQRTLHLDHHFSGPQRESQRHQGLGRPGQARRLRHHTQPENFGQRPLELSGAWGYALKKSGGDEAKAQDFLSRLYKNVPVLDSGARGATTTFVERGIGDVLINWENEILLGSNELGKDKFEIVVPPISILAEPTVSVVDKVADKKGTRTVAQAYLEYLYSEEGQEIAAKHYYRPQSAAVAAKYADSFLR